MTIKHRLFLLSAIITVAVLSMLALQQYTTQRSNLLHQGVTVLLDVEADMQILLAAEQNYLLTHSRKSRDHFFREQEELSEELHELADIMTQLGIDTTRLSSIYRDVGMVGVKFSDLEQLVNHIGLDENSGLRGALRASAHQVEKVFRDTGDYRLLSGLLMMRRHEKDFLLRLNNKYVDRYHHAHSELLDIINQTNLSSGDHNKTIENLSAYADSFQQLTNSKRRLGLRENEGLRAELESSIKSALNHQRSLVQTTRDIIQHASERQNQLLFSGTLLLIVILIGMALFIARSITRSLSRITEAMEHVANGSTALSATLPENGRDETAQIASAFNRFTAKLDNTVKQILMVATSLSQSSLRAQEITGATSNSIEEQVKAITHLSDTIGQMADSSQQVRSAIDNASDTVREVQQKAGEGSKVVESAVNGMQEMQTEVTRLEQSISALTGHHENVGKVLDMIITIAEQTNLLALNAAIEAARAGEHGRGFAVVADEVRALSQRTTEATNEVRKLMNSIRIANQDAVSLMDRSTEASNRNMERTAAAGDALGVIAHAVDDINESNVKVSTLAEQQSVLADEVQDNIQKIHNSVSALSELARKNISDNGDLSQFSIQLESLVAGFSGGNDQGNETQDQEGVDLF